MNDAVETPPLADIDDLQAKVDRLSEEVAFLVEEARRQQRQRREWAELREDLTPVAFDLYHLTVEQLEEVEQYVRLEDVLRLFKRLARNTQRLESLLDQLESMADLGQDLSPLTQDAFLSMMKRLDELERRGYVAFAREGLGVADRVVESFSEEDVRMLGENVVLILQTVKTMTQPDIMRLLQTTAGAMREEEVVDTSLFGLMRQLNDPAVKRGLSKTLNVLRAVSEN